MENSQNAFNSINCEIHLTLTWSANSIFTDSTGAGTFAITDTKLYVEVVTLSTQDNVNLLQQLKSAFKKNNQLE